MRFSIVFFRNQMNSYGKINVYAWRASNIAFKLIWFANLDLFLLLLVDRRPGHMPG